MAYSHNGCQRCKKVRVKCDEGTPSCKLCLKKGVECVYDFSILVYDPTQQSKKSRRRKQVKKKVDEPSSSSSSSATVPNQTSGAGPSTVSKTSPGEAPSFSKTGGLISPITTSASSSTKVKTETKEKELNSNLRNLDLNNSHHNQNVLTNSSRNNYNNINNNLNSNANYHQHRHSNSMSSSINHSSASGASSSASSHQNIDSSKHSSPFLTKPDTASGVNLMQNTELMERGLIIDTSLMDSEDRRILSAILPNQSFSDTSSNSAQDKLSIYSLSPPNALPSPSIESSLQYQEFNADWCINTFTEFRDTVCRLDPLNAHFHVDHVDEWDPKFQKFIWDMFIKTKCMLNYLYVIDDQQNYIIRALKILAPTNPIIGYVVNATTANLLEVHTQDQRWGTIRAKNMNICIKILARHIATSNDFISMSCLLISVMFLYSERSASKTNLWRLHLKGALGILQKCESMYLSIIQNSKNSSRTDELLSCGIDLYFFSKNWFIAAETIAWLSSPNGGCITDLEVSKELLNDPNCFYNSHGVLIGNFNTIKCCSQNLIPIFNRIIEVVMWLKLNFGINLGGFYAITNLNHPNFTEEIKSKLHHIGEDLLIQLSMLHNEDLNLNGIQDSKLSRSMLAADYVVKNALKSYIRIIFLRFSIYDEKIEKTLRKSANQLDTSNFPYGESIGVGIHWSVYFSALISSRQSGLRKSFLVFIQHIVDRGIYVGRNSFERLRYCWDAMDNGKSFSEVDFDCIAN